MNDKVVKAINKKIRKFNTLHFFIFLVFMVAIIIVIYNAYGKYVSSISSDTSIGIARWKILVNNRDVTNGASLDNVITPVFSGNDNIASGVIAPTAEGYFDITIDASDTDVSFKYIVTTSDNEDSAVQDLIISGYSIDNGERQDVTQSEDGFKIENSILYNDQDKDVDLRVYLKWNDDSENGAVMDNSDDTETTQGTGKVAKVNVNLRFVQIAN